MVIFGVKIFVVGGVLCRIRFVVGELGFDEYMYDLFFNLCFLILRLEYWVWFLCLYYRLLKVELFLCGYSLDDLICYYGDWGGIVWFI